MNQLSSSVRRPPSTERGRKTRKRILDAAELVFGELGYDEASISEITRRAKVALGSFYVYFPDKRAAFVELVDELGSRLRRTLNEAIEDAGDRFEKERAGLDAFFEFAAKHRRLYRIVKQAEFVDEAVFRRYYTKFAEAYVAQLEAAMDAGEIRRMNPEVLAYALMGMFDFFGMRWVNWGRRVQLDWLVDEAMGLLRNGLDPRNQSAQPRGRAR